MSSENALQLQLDAARQESTLFRQLLDELPLAVYAKDRQSRFVYANPIALRTLRVERLEDVVGLTDFDLFPREQASKYFNDEQEIIATGKAIRSFVEHVVYEDRSERWLMTSKMPTYDGTGEISGIMGFAWDVTEQKRAEEQIEHQAHLIKLQRETLLELATPIIPLMQQIIVLPLIGSIDSQRAQDIMRSLLGGISQHRARIVILDITGVPVVDSAIAGHLTRAIQAARLKGAETIVTGVSDAVAETIVDLGIDWRDVQTLADLESGLQVALKRIGRQVVDLDRGRL